MMPYDVPSTPLLLTVNGESLMMYPRRFKSGSAGWHLSQKVLVGDRRVQLSFSAVVVGSKQPDPLIQVDSADNLFTTPKSPKKAPKRPRKPKKGQEPSDNGQKPPEAV